jgi:hypothetical protein
MQNLYGGNNQGFGGLMQGGGLGMTNQWGQAQPQNQMFGNGMGGQQWPRPPLMARGGMMGQGS